jgi:hypothetical protein
MKRYANARLGDAPANNKTQNINNKTQTINNKTTVPS